MMLKTPADAARRHQGAPRAGGGGLADRDRAVPVDHARSGARGARRHGVAARAGWTSRRWPRRIPRRSSANGPIRRSGSRRSRRARSRFGLGLAGDQFKAARGADPEPLPRVSRPRRVARRDQSARRHRGRARAGARRQAELRRQRARSATRTFWRSATSTRRPRSTSRPRCTASTTSSSTAASGAW